MSLPARVAERGSEALRPPAKERTRCRGFSRPVEQSREAPRIAQAFEAAAPAACEAAGGRVPSRLKKKKKKKKGAAAMELSIAVATRSMRLLTRRLWKQFASVARALPLLVLGSRSWSCGSHGQRLPGRVVGELRHLALWLSTEARAPRLRRALQTALVGAVTRNAPPLGAV